MDLLPSSEQSEIISSSASFLRERLSVERTRSMFGAPSNIDSDAWMAAAELGWFSLGLPDAQGGIGFGLAEEALLFREIGRSLASGPFLSTVLGARVAAFGGNDQLATEIVGGRPVAFAIADTLEPFIDGRLNSTLQIVDLDAASGLVLVVTNQLAALVHIDQLTDVEQVPAFDEAVRLHRASASQVAPLVAVATAVDPVGTRCQVLVAAMLTGITESSRDISAEHAKVRVQFGKPIGVNQAIKHPCADMAVQAQLALAQTLFAAVAIDEGRLDGEFHAISARLVATQAAQFASSATVQVLGGMGFTFEHDAHLYVKRTLVLEQFLGGTEHQLAHLLDLPEAS
jgi:alkylation response protein AidB-like acyl-CoA dehydrogenase